MDKDTYLSMSPFAVNQAEKDIFFEHEMKTLAEYHRRSCSAYDDICNGLAQDCPYLPVSIFKDLELRSVPEEMVSKQITSSGTTGQQVSRIFLDSETSLSQQKALCTITADFIGTNRIPMLIIDSPDVLKDRQKFSARGAGILGFSIMSSRRFYALTPEMEVDWDSIRQFQEESDGKPSFAFGFTYMIWSCFYEAIRNSGRKVNLSNCTLIHGGGWKKLQDKRVSSRVFKAGLKETCNISKVSNYYGMVEQTGSIFMECPEGHLHASIYSDISILNPEDFSPCEPGEWGLIALQSFLPKSYPGHRLITEDWGRILGEDDCPCGRKGRYFEISGRISKAEIRGCSDTFERAEGEKKETELKNAKKCQGELTLIAGNWPPENKSVESFNREIMDFLANLSALFTSDSTYRSYPEIYALGFWCRQSHMEQIRSRQSEGDGNSTADGGQRPSGKGLTLHITPSNMPTMFAYSWISSLLAGNPNIVRLSERESEIGDLMLRGIEELLNKPAFAGICRRNAFVRFPRNHIILNSISSEASARIVWGGDETVRKICEIPANDNCIDITFPDKYSIALLDLSEISSMSDHELRLQAHLFYRDTFAVDQNACSSPKILFWLRSSEVHGGESQKSKIRWWNAVAEEAKLYDMQPWMATEKYRILCRAYAGHKGLSPVKMWSNRLYLLPCRSINCELWELEAKMGIFYEYDINCLEELFPYLGRKIQTVVTTGDDCDEIYRKIRQAGCEGVDRVVHMGEALNFDTIWDRKNLIDLLTE